MDETTKDQFLSVLDGLIKEIIKAVDDGIPVSVESRKTVTGGMIFHILIGPRDE